MRKSQESRTAVHRTAALSAYQKASQNSPPAMAANNFNCFSLRRVRGEKHYTRRECSFSHTMGKRLRVAAKSFCQKSNAFLTSLSRTAVHCTAVLLVAGERKRKLRYLVAGCITRTALGWMLCSTMPVRISAAPQTPHTSMVSWRNTVLITATDSGLMAHSCAARSAVV